MPGKGNRGIGSTLRARLLRPLRFVDSWWLPIGVGSTVGALVVFTLLFFEPFGTDRYEASFRNLRLSGYGLCVLLPFLLVHGLSRWWIERRGSVWRLGHELASLALLVLLVFNAAYLYNTLVINQQPLRFDQWKDFSLFIAIPYLPLLAPPAMLIRRSLIAMLGDRVGEERIVLTGRNQDDRLRLAPSEFILAEAEQNYVTLHYRRRGQTAARMFRATLAEIESQLPDALRVHRSYLINPARVQAIEGNARKRLVRLEGSDRDVPVSPRFELARLEAAAGEV
ncbi:LytTR family DNA-binding domain-containing protein [Wenzhouxiangella marina]|uniref:LytTr DNA-binding region n=1 Tax=Wenzhouxiangella marina TaxID=1579979 RepID=A0A0K0XRX1_9GAMM|nr:LytTR family DNA-binding domain-containing protein [Wenzhouxiangella marina]AKS40459.1 LytTr DNA-binding region [Wenzhouxiangella marina]MBB6088219.1 putative membrane protein [Wenzhouxiangella marina]